MEQVYNSMLNMMQTMTERQPSKPAQTQEKDSFQSQMKQAAGQSGKAETEKTVEQPQTQEGQITAAEDPKELEKQMALAAMAVMQNPVVPVEQAAMPEEEPLAEAAGVEIAAEAVVDTETVETPVVADAAELVVEEAPAETVEQLPQEQAKPVETEAVQTVEDTDTKIEVTAAETGEAAEEETDTEDTPEEGMAEAPVFRDVHEIPVKVGEAPRTEETVETPVEDQIGPKLAEALNAGETRVEIQLAPESLGKVTVEVTLRQDGTLHVALHAENSQTRGLLERSADNLVAMLGRDARQEVQVEVPRQQESQQQNFYNEQQGRERQEHQQQQERRKEQRSGEDFMHQLRLGLVPGDGE